MGEMDHGYGEAEVSMGASSISTAVHFRRSMEIARLLEEQVEWGMRSDELKAAVERIGRFEASQLTPGDAAAQKGLNSRIALSVKVDHTSTVSPLSLVAPVRETAVVRGLLDCCHPSGLHANIRRQQSCT